MSLNICAHHRREILLQKELVLENRVYHQNTLCVTKSAWGVFLILIGVALLRVSWYLDSCGVKDSKAAYTISGTRIDLLSFLKDMFDSSSGSSILIALYDLQYSW